MIHYLKHMAYNTYIHDLKQKVKDDKTMTKTTNWVFIPLTIIVIIFGVLFINYYNTVQALDEKQNSAASEVLNQYQRKSDLIIKLAETVQNYTEHEQSIFKEISRNRAQLHSLQSYENTQKIMDQQISQLHAVVVNYPELKANELYQNLMVQLEGTENRITVARNRYIEAIREYNTTIRKVPYVLIANMFDYQPIQFENKP
ncbi:LemA family protein [Wohlfahrtiimonas larvae]|uniref:LemA family protein n=1 Tax=Wohlfahrtiimonas larvae TaxID=1157986 RepID=A0ABP9MVA2_9GAMM|nr:LemA family protein [Wohlfahrtiimonas larvae]